ncbi:MAG: hypothetical protein KKA60_07305 [Proteobacteria bacterium]|nr:hypothetical protein [Pseudomonadota bacterium]
MEKEAEPPFEKGGQGGFLFPFSFLSFFDGDAKNRHPGKACPRAGGDPGSGVFCNTLKNWIPAFAGMTVLVDS